MKHHPIRRAGATLLALLALSFTAVAQSVPANLADINPGTGNSAPQNFAVLGGKLYFTAIQPGGTQRQLYSYDPAAAAGSQVVKVSNFAPPTATTTHPSWLRAVGSKLVMQAQSTANGPELHVYDPVTNVFTEVALNGTQTGQAAQQFLVHEGKLYFRGDNGTRGGGGHGTQLWVYNPAAAIAAGTNPKRLTNLNTFGDAGAAPANLLALPGKVLFSANLSQESNGSGGVNQPGNNELVMLDTATEAVTTYELAPGSIGVVFNSPYQEQFDGNPLAFSAVVGGNTLYFSGNATTGGTAPANYRGQVLWKFDPATMSGPAVVHELNNDAGATTTGSGITVTAVYPPGDQIQGIVAVGTKVFYVAGDGANNGHELWVCDTANGDAVTLAASVATGGANGFSPNGGPPASLTVFGGKLFFCANANGGQGYEPFRFDPAGPTLTALGNLHTTGDSLAAGFFPFDGKLYFRAAGTGIGTELYVHDPAAGTATLVADRNGIGAGANGFNASSLALAPTAVAFNNQLFYQGADTAVGIEPFTLASPFTITASPASATETSGTATTWTITRTGNLTQAVTVDFAVEGTATLTADYTQSGAASFSATAGTVTLGANVASASFTTTTVSDALVEDDETIVIRLTSQTAGGVTSALGASASTTIQNSAAPVGAPEITIGGNGEDITSGDTTPSTDDGTDFGSVAVAGGSAVRFFSVGNPGTAALNLTGTPPDLVTLSGTGAAHFSVTAQPASPVAPSANTTFQITYDPSAAGSHSATVTVASDDADEGTYTFAIAGTGTVPPPTLGSYSSANATIAAGRDGTVTPSAPPTGVVRATATARSANPAASALTFNGVLSVDPATGAVRVTNAMPAGVYTVTVTAFNSVGTSATQTFTLTVGNPVATSDVSFTGTTNVAAGNGGWIVAAGDFNEDGKQDLAVADYDGDTVSIRLGDGAGGFSGTAAVGVGDQPYSVAVGDFNGDGHHDLAVANSRSNTVSIRLGDGAGGFSGTTNVSVGVKPYVVVVGDWNGDGKADLVTGNQDATGTASVRLGDGAGNFSGTTELDFWPFTDGLAVGDFNGDGKADLVAANQRNDHVSTYLGNGAGDFVYTAEVNGGDAPNAVAVGDFNGDGKQDLAIANYNETTVSIRLGNGDGTFSGTTSVSVGAKPYTVVLGDFNGDGKADLATAGDASTNVSVRLGDGAGGFSGNIEVAAGSGIYSVAVGDWNGDGKQDLAAANYNNSTVSIRLNNSEVVTPPIKVTTKEDKEDATDGVVSLREAITAANANAGADTITFDTTVFAAKETITLTLGQLPSIVGPLTVEGPATGGVTISGDFVTRIGKVGDGADATFRNLTFYGGVANAGQGGAFINEGTASFIACTFESNRAESAGAILNAPGGTLTLVNCTFYSCGSTQANPGGGAILNAVDATLEAHNCTFTQNHLFLPGSGGAIYNAGTLTVGNCLFGQNSAANGQDVMNAGTMNSLGFNLYQWNSGSLALEPTDRAGVQPKVSDFLTDNGGPVKTIKLLNASVAIDGGRASGAATTDARGLLRPKDHAARANGHAQSDGSDIGAYEEQADPGPMPVPEITLERAGQPFDPTAGPIEFDPTTVAAGSSVRRLTIKNVGTGTLEISDASARTQDGSYALDYRVVSAPFQIEPNESGDVVIAFSPTAAPSGPHRLRIVSDDADEGLIVVDLLGTATVPANGFVEAFDTPGEGVPAGFTRAPMSDPTPGSEVLVGEGLLLIKDSDIVPGGRPGTTLLSDYTFTAPTAPEGKVTLQARIAFVSTRGRVDAGSVSFGLGKVDGKVLYFSIGLDGTPQAYYYDAASDTYASFPLPPADGMSGYEGNGLDVKVVLTATGIRFQLSTLQGNSFDSGEVPYTALNLPPGTFATLGDLGTGNRLSYSVFARSFTGAGEVIAALEALALDVDSGATGGPEIEVRTQSGPELTDGGSTVEFGPVATGTQVSETFVIKNTGTEPLTGVQAMIVQGPGSGAFQVETPDAVVAPNGQTSFKVFFSSANAGPYTATLSITSNDADEAPFEVTLAGYAAAAETLSAKNVTATGARLEGALNDGYPYSLLAAFQYGTTDAYGTTAVAGETLADPQDELFQTNISGLTPNTTYHFRIVLLDENMNVLAAGADRTFSTGAADTAPPVISLVGDAEQTVALGSAYADPGATAVDNLDGTLPVTASGTVDTAVAGTYTRTYAATDSSGNTASKTRTVIVRAIDVDAEASGRTFTGIIYDGEGDVAGAVTVTTRRLNAQNGAFTGTLTLGARRGPVLGSFASGSFGGNVTLLDGTTVSLTLSLDEEGDAIEGTVADGADQYTATLDRVRYTRTDKAPASRTGKFTALIRGATTAFVPNTPGDPTPAGSGYARITIMPSRGTVRMVGETAEGGKISVSTFLVGDGSRIRFNAAIFTGGQLGCELAFDDKADSDIDGDVTIKKPAQARGLFAGGYTATGRFMASRYTPVTSGVIAPFSASDLTMPFSGSFTATPGPEVEVTVGTGLTSNFTYSGLAPNDRVAFTVNRSYGTWATVHKTHAFTGVVGGGGGVFYQKARLVEGALQDKDGSGSAYFKP